MGFATVGASRFVGKTVFVLFVGGSSFDGQIPGRGAHEGIEGRGKRTSNKRIGKGTTCMLFMYLWP